MREVLGSMRTQTQRTRARGLLLGDQWVQGCGIPKASPDLPVDPRGCRTVACVRVRRGVPCLYLLAPDQSSRVRTHTHTHTLPGEPLGLCHRQPAGLPDQTKAKETPSPGPEVRSGDRELARSPLPCKGEAGRKPDSLIKKKKKKLYLSQIPNQIHQKALQ